MNTILVYFVIPLATIILSAILESFINCPIKVSGIFFSIFIVIAGILGSTIELFFYALIYTSISLLSAFLEKYYLSRCINNFNLNNSNLNNSNYIDNYNNNYNKNYGDIYYESPYNNSNILTDRYINDFDYCKENVLQNSKDSNKIITQNSMQNNNYYNRKYR